MRDERGLNIRVMGFFSSSKPETANQVDGCEVIIERMIEGTMTCYTFHLGRDLLGLTKKQFAILAKVLTCEFEKASTEIHKHIKQRLSGEK